MAKSPTSSGTVGKWTDIIKTVQNPLGFLVFIGLVAQALLLVLATRGTEYQGTIVIVALLVFMGVAIGAVIVAAFHRRGFGILTDTREEPVDIIANMSRQLSNNDLRVLMALSAYPSLVATQAIGHVVRDGKTPPEERIAKYTQLGLLQHRDNYATLSAEGKALADLLERARKLEPVQFQQA